MYLHVITLLVKFVFSFTFIVRSVAVISNGFDVLEAVTTIHV